MDVDLEPIPTPSDEAIQLKEVCQQVSETKPETQPEPNKDNLDIVKEFDVIDTVVALAEDDDDKEFELLATESLSKTPVAKSGLPSSSEGPKNVENWNAFGDKYVTYFF